MTPLVLNPDRSLRPPDDVVHAGWYAAGSAVGSDGTAIVAGHFDSKTGPGVFYRLGKLKPGDVVTVIGQDASVAKFVVYRLGEYSKSAFPTTPR